MSMEISVLRQVVLDQNPIRLPDNYFHRTAIDQIDRFKKNSQIIVISGIRRCGKSTLMQTIRSQEKESSYYFNFDDDRLVHFTVEDFQTLYELFLELFGEQSRFYFDEIQNIPDWERFVRRIHDQGHKVYITGSNATLFSRELGTRLTGRYIQIEMYPYSFREYVNHFEPNLVGSNGISTIQKGRVLRLFTEFYEHGGLPEYIRTRNKESITFLYEGVIYRDIMQHLDRGNEQAIKEVVYFLASNIGKEFSYSAIGKLVGIKNSTTISNWTMYLENSYLCFFLSRYNHSLKKQILFNKKCYFIDIALAKQVGFRPSEDRGRMMENIIFLELSRRYKEIYFHKEELECDFVIREEGRISQAIQVTLSLKSEETKSRELAGLSEAMQLYGLSTGLILTEDEEGMVDHNGGKIQILPIWKWLLN
jgi:predicted AAA+ superfamily ATPase